MTEFAESILGWFNSPDAVPVRPKELARQLGVRQSKWSPFKAVIEQLLESGQLRLDADGLLSRKRPPVLLQGKLRRSASGAGSVIPTTPIPTSGPTSKRQRAEAQGQEEADDLRIYIAPEDLLGALSGDVVEIALSRRRRTGGQRIGRVTRIIERAKSTFVGTYHERAGRGYVTIDAAAFTHPVQVGDPGAKGAKPNDKVVVDLITFPTDFEPAEGVITQVLGTHGEVGVDTLSIIHEFQLPDAFPEKVVEEARRVVREFDEHDLSDRVDLTEETIITIDPVDARDFDDAISLTEEEGHWRLGVHIADVSHFVVPGSLLDKEAERRGTSVYLPDRVLPMLPEQLSNGLASLQQGHLRYTKSVFIHFDPEGVPTTTEFANTAIRPARRFAYEEVLPVLDAPEEFRGKVSVKVRELLQRMRRLARILRQKRFARGALDLQLPEVKLDLNADGEVTGAHQVQHDESHQIIEEFMLAANIAVARRLSELGLPYLHRSHAAPDERKLRALGEFVQGMGFDVKPWVGREELQKLLDSVRGEPAEQAIAYAVLRSLKQAEYSPAEIGHFALAEDYYCHFTSPIRRYPDLLVHRLFDAIVRRGKKVKPPSIPQLARLGEHCSETERRAESAERELIKVKLLTYLKGRIGWQMAATVTGVERFGLFCLGVDLPADGMVHVKNLPNDQYDYDRKSHTLAGRRSGTVYRLGDRVRVEVLKVDLHQRTLDYRLVPEKPGTGRKSSKSSGSGKSSDGGSHSRKPATKPKRRR